MKKSLLTLGALLALTAPAAACYTANVENKSDYDVIVVWSAAGCGGVYDWYLEVCHHTEVKSGDKASYNYKWGTTAPVITVRDPHKKSEKADWSQWEYYYHGGKFHLNDKPKNSPPHCGEHYTVTFDNAAHAKDIEY